MSAYSPFIFPSNSQAEAKVPRLRFLQWPFKVVKFREYHWQNKTFHQSENTYFFIIYLARNFKSLTSLFPHFSFTRNHQRHQHIGTKKHSQNWGLHTPSFFFDSVRLFKVLQATRGQKWLWNIFPFLLVLSIIRERERGRELTFLIKMLDNCLISTTSVDT